MGMVLWILAVILAIFGVIQILNGALLWGIILLIIAAAVGPGGWSIFNRRTI
ncbi:MAG TPA: GPGG-motif small membrane protein [Actinomycetota bacterium]|nr:GPGG-motif small membrane protein [Actinomycetota bacterium]